MAVLNHRYDLVRGLGHGSSGNVFLGHDLLHDGAPVALKIIPVSQMVHRQLRDVRNEFFTLSGLDHPNLVQALDFGTIVTAEAPFQPGDHYLTYEFIEGEDLLHATVGISWQELGELAYQILRTLAYVHRHGLVHFDIKPENILVVPGSMSGDEVRLAKVIDFGFSSTSLGTGERSVRGTLAYLAPELLRSGTADHRADLYSFGMTLYHVMTGSLPVESASTIESLKRRLTEPPRSPRAARPDVPEVFEELIGRLTEPEVSRRVHTAEDAATLLEPFLERRSLFVQYYRAIRPSLFIGRTEEFRRLTQNLSQLPSAGRTVADSQRVTPFVVHGPHGIGKTRLLRELEREARAGDILFLEARCAGSEERAFAPIIPVLRELLFRMEIRAATPEVTAGTTLLRLLAQGGEELQDTDPTSARFRLIERIVRFLSNCAARQAFALWVDDADQADEATRDLVAQLGRTAAKHGFLVYVTATSTDLEPIRTLVANMPGEPLALRELSPEEALAFVRYQTGEPALPAEEVARLTAQVGSSPLMLSNLMSATSAPQGTDVGANLLRHIGSLTGTAALFELYRQRFDALGRDERDCLRLLSCFHLPVETSLFIRLLSFSPTRTRQALARLSNEGLIASPEYGHIFIAHNQFREFVYGGLGGLRVTLHRHIAEAMERSSPGRADDAAEVLAFHFQRAGDLRRAYRFYRRAAIQEHAISSFRRSAEFLEQARPLAPNEVERDEVIERLAETYRTLSEYAKAEGLYLHLLSAATTRERRLDLHRAIGSVQTLLGRIDDATQSLRDAALLAATPAERDEVDLDRASLEISRGDYTSARRLLEDLLTHVQDIAGAQERGDLYNRLGIVNFYENRLSEGQEFFARAVSEFTGHAPPDKLISPLLNLGNVYSFQGDFQRAEECWKQALTLTKKACNIGLEARIYNNLGIADFSRERYSDAAQHYDRAIDIFTRLGNRPGQALCLTNIGEVHFALGAYEQALNVWKSNLSLYESLDDNEGIAQVSIHLTHAYLMLGDVAAAADRLAVAAQLIGSAGLASQQGAHDLARAVLEFSRDAVPEAGVTVSSAEAFFEKARDWRNLCLARIYRGRIALAAGDRREAADAFQRALRVAREREFKTLGAESLCGLAVTAGTDRAEGLAHPLAYLKEAFELLHDAPVVETTWHVCLALGDAYRRRGLRAKAEMHLRIAKDTVEHLTMRFHSDDLRRKFLQSHGREEPARTLAQLKKADPS